MGKGAETKLDTIVSIEFNKNPTNVVLSEPLMNVEWLELQYIRIVDVPYVNFPPKFLYLEINGLKNGPRLVTNVIRDGSWTSTTHAPPSGRSFPLHFEVAEQGLQVLATLDWPYRTLYGFQHGINFLVEEFSRLSDFQVRILGENHLPLTFDNSTVAQLVFRAHYDGKRNLDPAEHLRRYNKVQN